MTAHPDTLVAIFVMMLAALAAKPVLVARLEPAEPPPPGPQVGFAGIGMPWKVERALKAA